MKLLLRFIAPVVSLAVGAVAVSLSGGCGSNTPTSSGQAMVRGKLVFNGKPIAGGLVVFTPNHQRGGSGKPLHALTASDGTFQLLCEKSPYIPIGWYRISLAPAPGVPDLQSREPVFPTKLARPDMSGLEREVLPGNNHNFEFVVEAN